jgi:hypothetical protein
MLASVIAMADNVASAVDLMAVVIAWVAAAFDMT